MRPQGVRNSGRATSIAITCVALCLTGAARADEARVARYLALEGGYEIVVDRDKLMTTTDTIMMTDSSGRHFGERLSYGFGDCTSGELVCAEFDEYVLAVPRDSALRGWSYQGWAFRRVGCLESIGSQCVKFAVRFENAAVRREGGFIFSRDRGVEMHFDANVARKEQWRIYVLASAHGLLHGGRL